MKKYSMNVPKYLDEVLSYSNLTNFKNRFDDETQFTNYIFSLINYALENKEIAYLEKERALQFSLGLILKSENTKSFVDLLNNLLISKEHESHQYVAQTLQRIADPKTIPFVNKVLENGFDYLRYTCSDDDVLAKWFSWILFSIGTDEAINVIKKYTYSKNEGIRNEMLYRLKKYFIKSGKIV
jgi:hypothetical protein